MSPTTLGAAPAKRFSKGPYATTTSSFDESGDFAATAWQDRAPRTYQRRWGETSTRWAILGRGTSAKLLVVIPIDETDAEASPTANITGSNVQRLTVSAAAE